LKGTELRKSKRIQHLQWKGVRLQVDMEFIAEDVLSDKQVQDSHNESHHPGYKYKEAMNILKPFRFTK